MKWALKGLALNMAAELEEHGVAAVSITPGFLRSEAMLAHLGVTEANWRDAGKKDPNFLMSESPLFVGRAVAAFAADPKRLALTGQLLSSWELARRYRFTDYDGRRPDWGRHNRLVGRSTANPRCLSLRNETASRMVESRAHAHEAIPHEAAESQAEEVIMADPVLSREDDGWHLSRRAHADR